MSKAETRKQMMKGKFEYECKVKVTVEGTLYVRANSLKQAEKRANVLAEHTDDIVHDFVLVEVDDVKKEGDDDKVEW